MRGFHGTVALCGLLFGPLFVLASCGRLSDDDASLHERVRLSITRLVESDSAAFSRDNISEHASSVEAFYRQQDFEPVWVEPNGSNERLRDILTVLCDAGSVGLNRLTYVNQTLKRRIDLAFDSPASDDSLRARRLALLDVTVTNVIMAYVADLLTGRIDPRELGSAWHTRMRDVNLLETITDTTTAAFLRRLPAQQSERSPEYGKMLDALERYQAIRTDGGWKPIPDGEPITEGTENARVRAVIERLSVTGDLDSSLVTAEDDIWESRGRVDGADDADRSGTVNRTPAGGDGSAEGGAAARYTPHVARAVERFQRRHGIEADGVVGDDVIRKMNVDVDERIRQIELNLERWRWIPPHLGSRYIYVNVPAFELHAVVDGREAMSMAVVVGEEYDDNATPVFSDTLEYVVFNPYWNVPESIALTEILPKAREDSLYLEANGYEIVTGWYEGADVVPPDSSAFDLVEAGEYRIRQQPGQQNALGRLKFMFPNDFNIYLHDTPEEHLFDRTRRAYSHGCIRVEMPVDLADFVLTSHEWTSETIYDQMMTGEHETVHLEEPTPVYILYWTAFVDRTGRVNFRDDIYGNDSALLDALEAHTPANEPVSCESLTEALDD